MEEKKMKLMFAQFDPRPQGAEANQAILKSGMVIGIEVTIPALAQGLVNLDHHGPSDTAETPSACEQALDLQISFDKIEAATLTLATVRPDADSVTAMAVMFNRSNGLVVDEELVHAVGRFDRFGPSAGKPEARVSAIARKACDFKVALADRVQWVADLLAGADKLVEITELCSAHDAELEAARKASELTLHANGRIAVVVSTHRFATTLGYESALVVVAMNPEMPVDPKDASKGTYRKYTVCRYDSHVKCDLPTTLKELQALEVGWGGRGDIFGSPQGISSILTVEQVIEVVSRHLK